MNKETHANQLLDGRWKRRRWEILNRDKWRCVKCGSDGPCDVHHKFYLPNKTLWDHPDECLVTLCRDCHSAQHPDKPQQQTSAAVERSWEKRKFSAARANALNQLEQIAKKESRL